jgi:hypothetical protein
VPPHPGNGGKMKRHQKKHQHELGSHFTQLIPWATVFYLFKS